MNDRHINQIGNMVPLWRNPIILSDPLWLITLFGKIRVYKDIRKYVHLQ